MKNRIAYLLAGIMLGAILAGPAASATEQIIAQQSSQTIYVDGRQTPMEAHSINGNNFVRLRDVGKAVGFDVSYDAGCNAVRIDTGASYTVEAAAQIPPAAGQGEFLSVVPDVGDRIICDDGYVYEIKDVSRYGTNVFQPIFLAALPNRAASPKVAKAYAESCGGSAPQSTWQSRAQPFLPASPLPIPCRICVLPS